jgi:hypothetical protein
LPGFPVANTISRMFFHLLIILAGIIRVKPLTTKEIAV